jgi:SurA N-terminal domain/PPIC-type PPIASE domain
MIKILRKHRNWLMIVIAILALPFCLYFVKSDTSLIRSDEFVKMYGRKVTMSEARWDARLFQLSRLLGMTELHGLAPGQGNDDQKAVPFIINLIVLRHEADRLGISPSRDEIVNAVRNFPAFQGPNGFDAAKYDQVEQNVLPSLGFTNEQLEQLARDEFCVKRIKEIVVSGVTLPESESKSNYERVYGKNFVSVVRLHGNDFLKEIKISDDDIKKYYEAHKSELKTEEKRKIEFVKLGLTGDQKKLKDKERIDALQKLADHANDVSQALLEKGADFHQVAAKFQLPVESTGEFPTSAPDPKLKDDPQLGQIAFKLSKEEPTSDPIQLSDGFAIAHLTGIADARPLTPDEAKPKIVDQLKTERSREIAAAKGRKGAETIRTGLKAGQPLQFTLEQAGGLKVEKIPPFTLAEEDADEKTAPDKPKDSMDMMMIKNVAGPLQPGEVSDFVPWIDGGFIVLVDKREAPDPAKYQETKAKIEENYLKNAREYTFMEWLRDRQREAGLQSAKS